MLQTPNELPVPPDETALRSALASVFARASVVADLRVDPEEGWTRRILVVHSGIADIDQRLAQEDKFYELLAANPRLSEALQSITVLFE
jgi:hypothetical protein